MRQNYILFSNRQYFHPEIFIFFEDLRNESELTQNKKFFRLFYQKKPVPLPTILFHNPFQGEDEKGIR